MNFIQRQSIPPLKLFKVFFFCLFVLVGKKKDHSLNYTYQSEIGSESEVFEKMETPSKGRERDLVSL